MLQLLYLLCLPRISIVIPVYNGEQHIVRALRSALSQTYENYEIIVINDGSTDDSDRILQSYQNNGSIKYFQLEKNRGTLYVRCLGIYLSSEFMIYLDAGDEIYPETLQKSMEKQQETGADCVYYDANRDYSKHGKWDPPTVYFENMSSGLQLHENLNQDTKFFYYLWGKLFRTEKLQIAINKLNILIGNRVVFSEDLLIFAAFLHSDPTYVGIDYTGYNYIANSDSVTASVPHQNIDRILMDHFAKVHSKSLFQSLSLRFGTNINLFPEPYTLPRGRDCNEQVRLIMMYQQITSVTGFLNLVYYFFIEYKDEMKKCYEYFNEDWDRYKIDNPEVKVYEQQYQFISRWKGRNWEEIGEQNLSISEIMEIVDEIWDTREKNADFTQYCQNQFESDMISGQKSMNFENQTLIPQQQIANQQNATDFLQNMPQRC